MKEEIKDIRNRIKKLQKEINNLSEVQDSVTGTRKDGTIGRIRISGYPTPEYYRKKELIERNQKKLNLKEIELLELMNAAEEYIESMEKSELRSMFRFYFIDGDGYAKTAMRLNNMYPKRKIAFNDENVKKRIQRYFENVPQCPDQKE
jgi:Ca2+-binding EF-hand superfamily protein